MKVRGMERLLLGIMVGISALLFQPENLAADPSKYPAYAQQELPKGVVPDFIYLAQLTRDLASEKSPLIIDVRTREEYRQTHIKNSISIPLDEMPRRLAEIPKNRLVVFY